MFCICFFVGVIVVGLLVSQVVSVIDFSQVVVFGDSLSDVGNILLVSVLQIQLLLCFIINFGKIVVELVVDGLGYLIIVLFVGGIDFVWGGVGLVNNVVVVLILLQQLGMYFIVIGGQVDLNVLYQVWGGVNDIFYLIGILIDLIVLVIGIVNVVIIEVGMLGQFKVVGVNYVVVYNLLDFGKMLLVVVQGVVVFVGVMQLVVFYNSMLSSGFLQLSSQGLNVVLVNIYGLINEVIVNLVVFGFSNVIDVVCGLVVSLVQCGFQGVGLFYSYVVGIDESYLFVDGVYLIVVVYCLFLQVVLVELVVFGQILLLGEVLLVLFVVQYCVICNEMFVDSQGSDMCMFVVIDYGQQCFDGISSLFKISSDNVNFMFGVDVCISEYIMVGVLFGVGQSKVDFKGNIGGYKLQDIFGQLFGMYSNGGGYVGGFVSFGQFNFKDIECCIQFGLLLCIESGKVDGLYLGGGVEGGWWFNMGLLLKIGLFVYVEWQLIKVNGYIEGGNDFIVMYFGCQQCDVLISEFGWCLMGLWKVNDLQMVLFVELVWNYDSKVDLCSVCVGFISMGGSFVLLGYMLDKIWGSVNIGLFVQFMFSVISWIVVNSCFSDSMQKDNSVNLGFKVVF